MQRFHLKVLLDGASRCSALASLLADLVTATLLDASFMTQLQDRKVGSCRTY